MKKYTIVCLSGNTSDDWDDLWNNLTDKERKDLIERLENHPFERNIDSDVEKLNKGHYKYNASYGNRVVYIIAGKEVVIRCAGDHDTYIRYRRKYKL